MAERKVIQNTGVLGNGRIECDGKDHWYVRPAEDARKLNCAPEVHAGTCLNPDLCKSLALAIRGGPK